jgi:hypothetical protein
MGSRDLRRIYQMDMNPWTLPTKPMRPEFRGPRFQPEKVSGLPPVKGRMTIVIFANTFMDFQQPVEFRARS